ncbi:MAG TPA: DUF1697 domain-containing protein [Burkholderiaceae bacterium]|nr:DUF1697 domain-containing protein [Burkholderiaceae bacterium]
MPRCIAFLRAVNVGGRLVKMDALRAAFESLGLANVSTFIASGNVLFETRARQLGALERKVETHLAQAFGFEIDTFIRTDAELAAAAAHAPFDAAVGAAAQTQVVGFLREPPGDAARATLAALNSDVDRFALHGRELYWWSRVKQSESTFSNAAFEKALRMRATFRGLNTLQRIVALA